MPRQPRYVIPGQPQHIIIRGNNSDPVFHSNEDYRFFLDKLKQACDKHQSLIHAYVLMTNHVHLLMTPQLQSAISKTIQMLGRYYVQYFNFTYKRTGTLWEGRYKATLIDSKNYLLTCHRYIELNPVRAEGMAEHPAEYPWSSYRFNALGQDDPLIKPHVEYLRPGESLEECQSAYRSLFCVHMSDKTLSEIRKATNKSWILGSSYFKDKIASNINRPVRPTNRGGNRKSTHFKDKNKIDRV